MFVVFAGRVTGVYDTWEECRAQVHRFPNAVHCKFSSKSDASAAFTRFIEEKNWLNENAVTCPRCEKMLKAKISNSKPSIGQHVLTCVRCGYCTSLEKQEQQEHQNPHGVEDEADCSTCLNVLEDELETVKEERDIYKYLVHAMVKMNIKNDK